MDETTFKTNNPSTGEVRLNRSFISENQYNTLKTPRKTDQGFWQDKSLDDQTTGQLIATYMKISRKKEI